MSTNAAEDLEKFGITQEDLKEISLEPGDVNDIEMQMPEKEKLDQLKNIIDGMPQEDLVKFLANLTNNGSVNPLNPNKNTYSSASTREMLEVRLKQKIKQKQNGRLSNSAKDEINKKMLLKKEQNTA